MPYQAGFYILPPYLVLPLLHRAAQNKCTDFCISCWGLGLLIHNFLDDTQNYTYILLDNPYLGPLITLAADDRCTDLQVFRQFSDWLLQEKGHEEEVECRYISMLREKGLEDRKAREMTRIPVNLPDC